ncbi:putative inorganic phosphate transporter 1-2 [Quercus suber]|uniref:Inorganic phosphate transporter 1-2 n=1 Tax=Quercus suber TaxID=58331 RepID=A0AAW0LQP2_QUESU
MAIEQMGVLKALDSTKTQLYHFTTIVITGMGFFTDAYDIFCISIITKFWLGFGIGGDYPLSATIMSEYGNKRTRGGFIAAVFAMQGMGILFGGIVGIVVASIFEKTYPLTRTLVSHLLMCHNKLIMFGE